MSEDEEYDELEEEPHGGGGGGGVCGVISRMIPYLFILSVGAIGGYATHDHLLSSRYAALMENSVGAASNQCAVNGQTIQETEDRWSRSMQVVSEEHARTKEENSKLQTELHGLQSKFVVHEGIAQRYADMLDSMARCNATLIAAGRQKDKDQVAIFKAQEALSSCQEDMEIYQRACEDAADHCKRTEALLTDCQDRLEASSSDVEGRDVELDRLRKEKEEIEKDRDWLRNTMERMERKMVGWNRRAWGMEEYVVDRSRADVIKRFGSGPHRVVFTLLFPSSDEDDGGSQLDKFVVEMAPLELMPHSVSAFLEMVANGLYNGCAFFLGLEHIIMAGPGGEDSGRLQKQFEEQGFVPHALAFQEYNAEFPHKKFTLGFAGSIGGPIFYISMIDNSLSHGPRGVVFDKESGELRVDEEDDSAHDEYGLHIGGEPCFAKVIDGFDVVERIHGLSHVMDDSGEPEAFLANPVTIVEARIVES